MDSSRTMTTGFAKGLTFAALLASMPANGEEKNQTKKDVPVSNDGNKFALTEAESTFGETILELFGIKFEREVASTLTEQTGDN